MSNKNTRKDNRRAGSPSQRYQKQPGKRRMAASIVALVIAAAVFVAYVIEVGMFVNM